jgi:diphosphomevalonate decarboxylase
MPRNPSVSITLDNAYTETTLNYKRRAGVTGQQISLKLVFDGRVEPEFTARMAKFLGSLLPIYPFLGQLDLEIDTFNSFPHSSGIASSASAMSAMALCIVSLERHFFGQADLDEGAFLQKASYIARLGSGSACRSVYPVMAAWGQHGDIEGSSDEYAVPLAEMVHEHFRQMGNAILIVNSGAKAVSSTAGHELMEQHPYAGVRYAQARQRMGQIIPVLQQGDWDGFVQLVEDEALTLHALMMASRPSYILMQPNSLELIQRIRNYRKESGIPICFSLDAGPNLHVLYPQSEKDKVRFFLEEQAFPLCERGEWIDDRVGQGPVEI